MVPNHAKQLICHQTFHTPPPSANTRFPPLPKMFHNFPRRTKKDHVKSELALEKQLQPNHKS